MIEFDLPIDPALPVARSCRVCNSKFVAYMRPVPLQRMPQFTSLYYCMDCGSFLHPQIYREPLDQLFRDAQWHISVEERNRPWANEFFDAALKKRDIRSVIELGCGTGTFLSVAKSRGITVYGHDTNPHVPTIARERHGITVDSSMWTATSCTTAYDLLVCISTFEHLVEPRALMAEIATYCRRTKAAAYISVPFATERTHWDQVLVAKPELGNPLYFADVHLTHFTKKGFEMMAGHYGATELTYFKHGWMGYWLEFQ